MPLRENDAHSEGTSAPAARVVEHFFRHEAGRLVSVLGRLFGLRHLDLVEEMVQASLLEALQAWRWRGVPDNPSAWMHRVARNKVIDALRQRDTVLRLAPAYAQLRPASIAPQLDDLFLDSEIEDSQLRMMFACCHPLLDRPDQLALTLKTLCGFSFAEIARGLLAREEAVKKRVQRARARLVEQQVELAPPRADQLPSRLDAVHQCLYLMFNEGYAASTGDAAIRADLCEEAARLCHLLRGHPQGRSSATSALLALMLFHGARLEARTDEQGRVLLLEDQDRSKWDQRLIARAKQFLDESASGTRASVFHLEAGIALLHCSAPSFAETNWPALLRLYDVLAKVAPSPVVSLNRAIVIAHIDGPAAGIRAAAPLVEQLPNYHLLDATLGELQRRNGDTAQARIHWERARTLTQSAADRELLERRLRSL